MRKRCHYILWQDPSKHNSHFSQNYSPLEIASSRSTPAILLLDSQLKVAYYNSEALDVLNNNPFLLDESSKTNKNLDLSPALIQYCNKFKESINNQGSLTNSPPLITKDPKKKQYYCIRLAPVISSESKKAIKYNPHLILLIEKIIPTEHLIASFQLSKREKEVLEQLFVYHTNKEIAKKLDISEYTVGDHIKNLMKKMNAKNRLSLVLKFLEAQSTCKGPGLVSCTMMRPAVH